MEFSFFSIDIIHGFTSTFVAICTATSYPFGFLLRSKRSPIYILKFFVATLRNQYKKVSFILVDEDGALEISSEFMRKFHNINIPVQNTGVDVPSLNRERSEIPNNKMAYITRKILINPIHKKGLLLLAYKYTIWVYQHTDNRLCGDVPYFL